MVFVFHQLQTDMELLLNAYRDLIFKHEALKLALEQQLPIAAEPSSVSIALQTGSPSKRDVRSSMTDAAGTIIQKLSFWGRSEEPLTSPAGPTKDQSTLLHSLFGRGSRQQQTSLTEPNSAHVAEKQNQDPPDLMSMDTYNEAKSPRMEDELNANAALHPEAGSSKVDQDADQNTSLI